MADLNLRDVDVELIKELKQAALEAGWTLKELCVHRLKGKTYGEIQRPTKQPERERSERVSVASESAVERSIEYETEL